MRNSDALRRLFMLMTAAILCILETAVVIYIMNRYYNHEFRTMLYLRGHILMSGIYIVILIFLGRVFGGLMVGVRKTGEVLFSHFFMTVFADLSFYVLLVLLSLMFPNPAALIAGAVVQITLAFIIIFVMGSWYRKIFRPYDVLLIYGRDSVDDFALKLETRKDQFHVSAMIDAGEDPEVIKSAIDKTATVMLVDIEAARRNKIFKYCYENSKRIYVMPKISDIILNGASPIHLFDTPLLLTEGNPFEYEERVIKRAWDIFFSLFLLVILSPVMLITAMIIKLSDGGPVFYRQIRCTKNAKRFEILKFRSMVVDAEKAGKAVLATQDDPRITKVGKVIRKCRIDELPQLINVLKGDMSFVGPRPERPEFIEKYMEEMPEFSYRMKVRAGITGYAQLYGKYNTKPYDKLKFDLYYIEQFSLGLDIRLMILTFKILFTKESTEGTSERIEA
ncbi:MAG: sugar transferase [Lachnospiraceae bacterium]|nr:sugar transferase [Lachnospiraceae bacterium]